MSSSFGRVVSGRAAASLAVITSIAACSATTQTRLDGGPDQSSPPEEVGTGGDGERDALASCDGMTTGPLTTDDRPRPTFGWTFVAPAGNGGSSAAGGAGGGAGGSGGGTMGDRSAWTSLTDALGSVKVSCSGLAWLQIRTSGPVIQIDDGSLLAWQYFEAPVPPPSITHQQDGGDQVWIDFEQTDQACYFCEDYRMRSLVIRDSQGGPIRFMAREGVAQPDLTAAEEMELFGVTATAQPRCTLNVSGACLSFTRTVYEHVLATTPPSLVPAGSATTVATTHGNFDIAWTASTEADEKLNCADGPGIAHDTGFVAVRLAP
jgi:hypothetical protein